MEWYFPLKLLHILSSTLLFGTGLGTAFFALSAHRSGDLATIAHTWRHVVWADNLFTWPAVVLQPITGYLLIDRLGLSLSTPWILYSLILYLLIGLCWLPVLWLQARLRDLALTAQRSGNALGDDYRRLFRYWFALGWPAFVSVIAIFALMVLKPS
ncbi:DUF2269 domain-containing protein [Pseudoxanthomonas sp. CAU 1598]|uniref:DUF2269 domain-containing protein n=2 Tax=Pseudomarimonas arenosa TaxID=2774145 RepID=A0AAW3ZNL5_9GAMM|nr:DUF2269 domain-containing protein [Pseudomarimonas arenosa]